MRTARQTLIVCRKELRDSLRDRRALWSILFSVVIGPVLIGFMMNKLADRQRDADAVRVPIVGMHRAPALVNWLNQQAGVHVVEGPAEAEKAVREQREAVVVIVPDDFAERFRSSRPAPLQLVADSSRNDVRPSVQRVQILLQQYAAEISSLRLIMRGVSPAAMRPLAIEEIEVIVSLMKTQDSGIEGNGVRQQPAASIATVPCTDGNSRQHTEQGGLKRVLQEHCCIKAALTQFLDESQASTQAAMTAITVIDHDFVDVFGLLVKTAHPRQSQ